MNTEITKETLLALAYRMFERNMEQYQFDVEMLMEEWTSDPGLQLYWQTQVLGVLEDMVELGVL